MNKLQFIDQYIDQNIENITIDDILDFYNKKYLNAFNLDISEEKRKNKTIYHVKEYNNFTDPTTKIYCSKKDIILDLLK